MNDFLLASLATDRSDVLPWHDRIQIALAIAEADLLKSLLVNCTPPIAQPHRIGGIHSTIGIPVAGGVAADGMIEFEEIHCVLAESSSQLEQEIAAYSRRYGNQRGYIDLTRCETETRTLGQMIPLAQAIAILTEANFTRSQVQKILNMPLDSWFKSWWYQADAAGEFTIPFLRLLRSRHFADGSVTLQYKDFFAHEQPPCFKSCRRQVIVEIVPELQEFPHTLAKINLERQQTGITPALLISDRISNLAAHAFMSQGISIYAAQEITLPTKADCLICATPDCPMRGRANSPVLLCQRFCLEGREAEVS